MTTLDPTEEWVPPQWHPDFGDASVELERLRSLAIATRTAMPGVTFALEIPEPGIIELAAVLRNGNTVKLLSVPAHERGSSRFAIFLHPNSLNEIEEYRDSENDVVAFLCSHAQPSH